MLEVVEARRSIRAFEEEPIDPATIDRILAATNRAPSAGNLQSYEIVLVRDASRRRELARAAGQDFLAQAPALLVFFMHPAIAQATYGEHGRKLYAYQDAAIAAAYAQLAAHALGLGAVWIGAFDDDAVTRAVDAPPSVIPAAIIAIGFPAERAEPTTRRKLSELVHEESFSRSGRR